MAPDGRRVAKEMRNWDQLVPEPCKVVVMARPSVYTTDEAGVMGGGKKQKISRNRHRTRNWGLRWQGIKAGKGYRQTSIEREKKGRQPTRSLS